jgi:hypothetical protein
VKRSSTLLAIAAACAVFSSARADVKLPAIFSDHMLLQQDRAVPVWGWADAGEQVSVSLAGQTKTTQAGADGTWSVKLDKLAAGGQPQTLTVQGKNTVNIQDVLVGEVWLCAGQSNMAMNVARAKNFEQEKAAARLPQIRMFKESSGGARHRRVSAAANGRSARPRASAATTVVQNSTTTIFIVRTPCFSTQSAPQPNKRTSGSLLLKIHPIEFQRPIFGDVLADHQPGAGRGLLSRLEIAAKEREIDRAMPFLAVGH